MDIEQLIIYFIVPALDHLGYTAKLHQQLLIPNAVQLVVITAAPESDMCRYVRQKFEGNYLPENRKKGANSWWQVESKTANDLYDNWLPNHPQIEEKLADLMLPAFNGSVEQNLLSNPIYAAAMCRLHYYRYPEKIPIKDINKPTEYIKKMFDYYKKYYNSHLGATTFAKFSNACHKFGIFELDYPKLIKEGLRLLTDKIL